MHGSWLDFIRLINIIISAFTENAKTDMSRGTGLYVGYITLHTDQYQLLIYVWGALVFWVCGSSTIKSQYHLHIKKIHIDHGDKPAATEIRNISANIASFFYLEWAPFSLQTRTVEAMLRSTWEGKTPEFSFPRDCGLRCPTSPNSGDPGRRAGPFSTVPTLVSHSFHLFWRREEVGVFVGQKEVSSSYFSIFHEELAWHLTFFMPSFPNQLQTCNNQLWKR